MAPASVLERQIPTDRFELLGELGAGGMGAVFRVRDRQSGRVLALKSLLHDGRMGRKRFLREFSAIARLSHPGLVQVEEYFETEAGACFTMELVEGADLSGVMGRPWRELVPTLGQVLDALAYIHRRRMVHRDVKPQNVLLAGWREDRALDEVQAKLADFGIVKELDQGADGTTALTEAGSAIGTVAYMAPEQARGDPVDGRSDLYAFGVMLYEAVTGQLPFYQANNNVRLLVAKDMGRIVDPLEYRPDTPPPMRELIMSLLARQPAQRPASAAAVRARLQGLHGDVDTSQPTLAAGVDLAASCVFVRPSLHGRDDELARLVALTRRDGATCLLLEGAAGIGKTALLGQWRRDLVQAGGTVLYTSCEGGGDDAMQLAGRLVRHHADRLRHLGNHSPGQAGEEVLRRLRGLLEPATLDPHDATLDLDVAAAPAQDHQLTDRLLLRQMFDLLLELSADGEAPLTVIVEDLQRADPSQAELLDSLVSYLRVEGEGLGRLAGVARQARVVLSGRPLVEEGPAQKLLAALASRRVHDRLRLGPLSAEASLAMVAELTGLAVDPSQSVAKQILVQAGGVPMIIEGLVRHHAVARTLELGPAGEPAPDATPDEGAAASSRRTTARHRDELRAVVTAEIQRMGEGSLELLQLAAVLGARSFELDALVALTGQPEDRVLQVLDGAMRFGFVEEDTVADGRFRFRFGQALVPEILLSDLSAPRVRQLHRRAAAVLAAADEAGRPRASAMEVARHLLASDQPTRAVPFLLDGAARALGQRSHGEAAFACARALEHGGDDVVDAAFARMFADALLGDGQLEESLAWYERTLSLLPPNGALDGPNQRARAAVRASRVAARLSRLDRASELAFLALEDLGLDPPRSKIGSTVSMTRQTLSFDIGWLGRLERNLASGAPPAEPPPREDYLAWDAVSQLCMVEMLRFTDIWASLSSHTRLLRQLAHRSPGPTDPLLAERLAFHATMFMEYRSREKSRRLADAALALAARTPAEPACLDALGQAVFVLMADADLCGAAAAVRERVPLVEQHAQRAPTLMALQTMAEALTLRGDFEEAAWAMDALRRTASHLRDQHILLQADGQQAFLEVYQDPNEGTLERWDEVIRRTGESKDRFVNMWFTLFRPHALFRVRDHSAALDAIPAARRILEEQTAYLHTPLACGYMGLILGDELWRRGGADRQVEAELRWHLKLAGRQSKRVRLLQPIAQMLEGELAQAAGKVARAEELLRAARQTEHAKQSPLLAFQIDARGALWALRRGEAGARQKLTALAAMAREDGWLGEARLLERYLAE